MKVGLLVIVLATLPALPLLAHHTMAMYDSTKPVTITGTVTKVEWINPHAWVSLSVKKDDGTAVVQRIEIAAPNHLKQLGFDRSLLPIGSSVSFEAWLPKAPPFDGPNGRSVTLSDGRRFDVSDNWPPPMTKGEPR